MIHIKMTTTYLIINWIMLLVAVAAWPEIPSKGKHAKGQEAQQIDEDDSDLPGFPEPVNNVTVSVGRDALLACVVDNLKGYKVAWVRVDTQTILSIHHNVISQNNRISLSYNDHRSWYLHIREVEESDRGWYMCQVNTDPMRSQKGYLQVVVPPVIVESMTSNDMVVREGLNVTLLCKARGFPDPYVMWRREDGEEMLIGGEHVNVVDGEMLHITKVSRLHMAAYLCVASNGVPPSISKRVHLRVQFPPMLSIPNQLEGAYVGQDVVLECHTEAYPASINYWTTERGDMIISDTSRAGDKYETTSTISGYTKYMKLKIRSVGPNDFGTYRCVAKNSLGETDGNIKLDELPTPTTAITPEMSGWNRSLVGKHRHRNKFDLNALPDYGVEEWRDGVGNDATGNTVSDSNQTPMRNPPGAFHNSANALAQHNLLGGIILWIKMQSFGIYKHLTSWYQWQRQHRKDKKQNEQRQKKEQSTQKQKNWDPQKRKQQQQLVLRKDKWPPVKRQRKNHFSSLQRFTTAYEQSTPTMDEVGWTSLLSYGAVTYTQYNFYQPLPKWLIRRGIRALKMVILQIVDSRAKFDQVKGNELPNKREVDFERKQSHMILTLRLLMLTGPILRAISIRVTQTEVKIVQLMTKLHNLWKLSINVSKNSTNVMNKTLQHLRAELTLQSAVNDRKEYSHITKNPSSGINEGESEASIVTRPNCQRPVRNVETENVSKTNNNINRNRIKSECLRRYELSIASKFRRTHQNKQNEKFDNNCEGYNTFSNNNETDFQISHTKVPNRALIFLIFPFIKILMEIKMIFVACLSLLLFFAYLHVQKQQQIETENRKARILVLILPLISSSSSSSNSHGDYQNKRTIIESRISKSTTVTEMTTTAKEAFSISCQRLTSVSIKIISKATRIIRLLCCRQWSVWKIAIATAIAASTAITTKTASPTLRLLQPQTVTISSRKIPTITRRAAAAMAVTEVSKISMHVIAATTPTTPTKSSPPSSLTITCTVTATLRRMAFVATIAECYGTTLR